MTIMSLNLQDHDPFIVLADFKILNICLFSFSLFRYIVEIAEREGGFWCCNQGSYQATTKTEGEEEETSPGMLLVSTHVPSSGQSLDDLLFYFL